MNNLSEVDSLKEADNLTEVDSLSDVDRLNEVDNLTEGDSWTEVDRRGQPEAVSPSSTISPSLLPRTRDSMQASITQALQGLDVGTACRVRVSRKVAMLAIISSDHIKSATWKSPKISGIMHLPLAVPEKLIWIPS